MSKTDFLNVYEGDFALCHSACKDCNREKPKMIMIPDYLWLIVCDDKGDILCRPCIEVRLGRKLASLEISMTYVNIVNWFDTKRIIKMLERRAQRK